MVTILPIVLTFYFLYWTAVSIESLMGDMLRLVIPNEKYRLGMGVIIGLLLMFFVGLLMRSYVMQRLLSYAESLFYRIPIVKSLYLPIKDFFDYFSATGRQGFKQVVAVSLGSNGMELIGFVTRSDTSKLPEELRDDEKVLVYLPMSYMIGGYTILVPRSAVRPVSMSMEEALRFTLTAGITGKNHKQA